MSEHVSQSPSPSENPWWLVPTQAVVIVACIVLMYGQSVRGPFFFDDYKAIVENQHLRQLWPLGEAMRAPDQNPLAGRPVVSLTFAINYAIGKLDPVGYHVGNMAIHCVAAMALLGLVRRTLTTRQEISAGAAAWVAFTATLLWAVHPLLSEAVVYVTQRTELMGAMFFTLGLYCCVRGWQADRRLLWFVLAVACSVLGMASKEIVYALPVVVLLYDRQFVAGTFGGAVRRSPWLYAGLAGSWVVLAVMVAGGPRDESVGFHLGVTAWEYLLMQARVLVGYLWLAVWPMALTVHHARPTVEGLADVWAQGLMIVGLLGVTCWGIWRQRWWGVVGAVFFLVLAPTSSFVPIVTEVAAERRMYLPTAMLVILVVVGGWRLGTRAKLSGSVMGLLAAVVIAGLAWRTDARLSDYKDRSSIWRSVLRVDPDSAAGWYSLAVALEDQGKQSEAMAAYRKAAQLGSDKQTQAGGDANIGLPELARGDRSDPRYHAQLGVRYAQAGDYPQAVAALRQAVALAPGNPAYHNDLGLVLRQTREFDAAIRAFEAALKLKPNFGQALRNLAMTLEEAGKIREAQQAYQMLVEREPTSFDAHDRYGSFLARQGRLHDAIAEFQAALAIDPANRDTARLLGESYRMTGQLAEAEATFRKMVEASPNDPDARWRWARALADLGQTQQAIAILEETVTQIDPNHSLSFGLLARLRQGKSPAPDGR